MTGPQQTGVNDAIQQRFKELPKVVQGAITSADVQKELRQLADTRKLHLDQWQLLENNVMLTLLGFQPPEELEKSLQEDLDISRDRAADLATDISRIVFEPIRQELERELEHPEAKEKEVSSVETAREQVLAGQPEASSQKPVEKPVTGSQQPVANSDATISNKPQAADPVAPATPPAAKPTEKATRMPASGAYKPGEASSTRKDIQDDPYREPPQ